MLEKLSRSIAIKIKAADPDGPVSVEVMEYALGVKLNFYLTVALTIIAGVCTGYLWGSLLSLASFGVIRRFSGGYHFSSLTMCAIITAAAASIIPMISINHSLFWYVAAVNLVTFLIYAPNQFTVDYQISHQKSYRLICVILILTFATLQSDILMLSCLLQAVTILPWKGGAKSWGKA